MHFHLKFGDGDGEFPIIFIGDWGWNEDEKWPRRREWDCQPRPNPPHCHPYLQSSKGRPKAGPHQLYSCRILEQQRACRPTLRIKSLHRSEVSRVALFDSLYWGGHEIHPHPFIWSGPFFQFKAAWQRKELWARGLYFPSRDGKWVRMRRKRRRREVSWSVVVTHGYPFSIPTSGPEANFTAYAFDAQALSCVIERAGLWDLGLPFIKLFILVILTWFLNCWVFYKSNLPTKMCAKGRAYSQSAQMPLWESCKFWKKYIFENNRFD